MKKRALYRATESRPNAPAPLPARDCVPVSLIPLRLEDWLIDCELEGQSRQTNATRRVMIGRLLWFLGKQGSTHCGSLEIREFMLHLLNGHLSPDGRWGDGGDEGTLRFRKGPQYGREVAPSTRATYYAHISSFFRFMRSKGDVTGRIMDDVPKPKVPPKQPQPFATDQVLTLRRIVQRTAYPVRDEAILLLLIDSGMRVSELCGIRLRDLDLDHRRVNVTGKGNKQRRVVFGRRTARRIAEFMAKELGDSPDPNQKLFVSDRGKLSGEGLTRSGVLQLFQRLQVAAGDGIKGVRCSPHTCRHTYAVSVLRDGGNLRTLQEHLGHEDGKQTQKYINLAENDVETLARKHSPIDKLGRSGTL